MTIAQRSTASRLLTAKGQTMTLAYIGDSTYNPATSDTSGAAPSSVTVAGAILPLQPFRKAQGNIVEGDQQLLLSALDINGSAITAPQVNATVTDAGSTPWTLVSVEPLAPAGLNIMFDCVARRAA